MPCTVSDISIEGTMDYLHYVVVIPKQSSSQPYIESSDLLRASVGGSGRDEALALRIHVDSTGTPIGSSCAADIQ